MTSIRSMLGPGRQLLARHLSRLSETLENFGARLRDAVSSAVGETVSGVVRETVRAALAEEPPDRYSSGTYTRPFRRPRPLWARPDEPDEQPWYEDPGDYSPDDDMDEPPGARADKAPITSRLPRAIVVGLTTALGWFRRGIGRFPVLTAVAVGLMTAAATYAGGPLAAAAVGVAGSAFNLLSFAEAVQAGAGALAAFGSP